MKKSYFFILSAAAIAFASCSDESVAPPVSADGVTFTVQIDNGVESRALGDGTSAKTLMYAVYDADSPSYPLVESGSASFSGSSMSTSVNLRLANGKNYKVAFFAYYNYNSVYTFDAEAKTVTVNYQNMSTISTALSKDHDSFYAVKDVKVTGAISESVTLTRPMAQINWGTDDYDPDNKVISGAYSSLRTKFKVSNAANVLNLIDGTVDGSVEAYARTAAKPVEGSNFPVAGKEDFTYMSVMYLLVPDTDAPVADLSLECYSGSSTLVNTITVNSAPVARNYRTNIFGSLLTNPASFTVTKEKDFALPDYNQPQWSGEPATPPTDAEGNYTVSHASHLAGIAQLVNGGNTLQGKKVILTDDIDLLNLTWTPIGSDGTNAFKGTFDGQGHTVKNLNVSIAGKAPQAIGLFGTIGNKAVVENLTIENAVIDATGATGDAVPGAGVAVGNGFTDEIIRNVTVRNSSVRAYRQAAGIVGSTYGNVSGCTVENTTITLVPEYTSKNEWDNADKAGAIVGYTGEGSYTFTDNTVTNVTVSGYRHIGAIVGYINYGNIEVNGNTVNGAKLIQDFTQNYKNLAPGELIGEAYGYIGSGSKAENNTLNGITIEIPQYAASASEVVAAIENGGQVYITESIDFSTIPGTLTVDKPTTINLSEGKDIKVSAGQIVNTSDLTIKGTGTLTGTKQLIINDENGTLTIKGGNFVATASGSDLSATCIHSEGNVIIEDGNFASAGTYALNLNYANVGGKTTVINGGTFTSNGTYGGNFYSSTQNKFRNEVIINGGTFMGANGGAKADGNIEITINNGTFITEGAYHAFYLGAESYGADLATAIINGGDFYSLNGCAIGANTRSSLTVNGAFVNRTNGFTPAEGHTVVAADKTITVGGKDYTLTYQVK